jgi:hypothetical protein
MRIGPNTGVLSGQINTIHQRVVENGGEWEGYVLCEYCHGCGVKIDRVNNKPIPCDACQCWGFVKKD